MYACDPIREQTADLAVLDCAYGLDETPYEAACDRLARETERLFVRTRAFAVSRAEIRARA